MRTNSTSSYDAGRLPSGRQFLIAVAVLMGILPCEVAAHGFNLGVRLDFPTGLNPKQAVIGDLNGDEALDLAVANYGSHTVSVLLGNGTGGFGAKTDTGDWAIYPNPFNPRTMITFDLAEADPIDLAIYDMGGRLVRVMESGSRSAGRYQATWDGRDNDGRAVSTRTCFCRLSTAQGSQTRKMTLAR